MRAVELLIQGREEPRFLLASMSRLPRPKKAARWIAGLANAAAGRRAVLLVGIKGSEIRGIQAPPEPLWWVKVQERFPGAAPQMHSSLLDIDGATVLAITIDAVTELLPARHRDRVIVPWVEHGRLGAAPASRPSQGQTTAHGEALPSADVLGGWVQRTTINRDGASIDAYTGQLDLELLATPGTMTDDSCSATLLLADNDAPIALATQIHPAADDVGVFRTSEGIDVRTRVRVRLLLAGAERHHDRGKGRDSAQLVVSLLLPGRTVPELRSLLLANDQSSDGDRWLL